MLPLIQVHHAVPLPSSASHFTRYPTHHQLSGVNRQASFPQPPHHHHHRHANERSHYGPPSQRAGPASALPSASSPAASSSHLHSHSHLHPTGSLHRRAYAVVPSRHRCAETSLRRKTPSGTIDAGYDGAIAPLAQGPPPLKHLILPVSAPGPYVPAMPRRGMALANHPSMPPALLAESAVPATEYGYGSYKFPRDRPHAPSGLAPAYRQHYPGQQLQQRQQYASVPHVTMQLPGIPPPVPLTLGVVSAGPSANPAILISGNSGVTCGTVDADAAFWPGMGWARPSTVVGLPPPLDDGIPSPMEYTLANPAVYDPTPFPGDYGQVDWSSRHAPCFAPTARSQPSSSSNLFPPAPALTLTGQAGGDIADPTRIQEAALMQAYNAYVGLVSHAQSQSRMAQTSPGGGGAQSAKLPIHPKPPRPVRWASSASSSPGPTHGTELLQPIAGLPELWGHPTAESPSALIAFGLHGGGIAGANILPGAGPAGTVLGAAQAARSGPPPVRPQVWLGSDAKTSLELLKNLCEQSQWTWVDGMLLGGCLFHVLERYAEALQWFTRILDLDSSRVEAISNMAATLYCLNRRDEAEAHWLRAVKLHPDYLESAEHLATVMYKTKRREAVQIIDYVQKVLFLPPPESAAACDGQTSRTANSPDPANPTSRRVRWSRNHGPGFGTCGYAIPDVDNGRMLALVHAKATMLYGLKDVAKAAEAFEEAVMISVGRTVADVGGLVRAVRTALARPQSQPQQSADRSAESSGLLLLPPETAKQTARLTFSGDGDLPGLRCVPAGAPKRAAVQTASNALLSLAKIFQDCMSSSTAGATASRKAFGVGEILALYYLSLSLQESPSTANNVGILLAAVQQPGQTAESHRGGGAWTSSRSLSDQEMRTLSTAPGSGVSYALAYYKYGLELDPSHVHLLTNYGSLLKDIGLLDAAIGKYELAVAQDPGFDIALTNLANAVKDRGRVSEALAYYRRAVAANPDFAEAVCGLSTALGSVCDWRGRGGVLLQGGRYDRWHVGEDGMLQDVHMTGRSVGLMKKVVAIVTRQLEGASRWGCYVLQPPDVGALVQNVAEVTTGGVDDNDAAAAAAAASFVGLIQAEVAKWAGRRWEGLRVVRLVERATRVKMRQWYLEQYVTGEGDRRRRLHRYSRPRLPASFTTPSAPTVLPFHTFTCPLTAKQIREISQLNALRISFSTLRSSWLPDTVYPPPAPPSPQLNVGYLSSDFNNHPLAHLMQSVFGLHNRDRARAFCYATTPSDGSVHRQQIEREAPVFRDVSSWSADRIAGQVVRDGIHIFVNLNGYTRGARNEIFAARPAPIQMSFMGFAGTLGAEWCDYLLADETAIPPATLRPHRGNNTVLDVFRDGADDDNSDDNNDDKANRANGVNGASDVDDADDATDGWMYSENIIFCRDTFFCCDHAQSCDEQDRTATWEDEQRQRWEMRKKLFPGLPEDAVILANFNQLYKIDPTTFRSWLRILSAAPRAFLWLLKFPELGEANLRNTARSWASADVANRIIFTDVAAKQEHISRARVCDLFLDTPECNAHTTAADVLWSSTPILTLPRYPYKMCSRMAASILKGALPRGPVGERAAEELVAVDEDHYERSAIRLANGLTYQMTGREERYSGFGSFGGFDDFNGHSGYDAHGAHNPGSYGEGHGRLTELRRILFDAKWTCALFNTRRWVSELETAYEEAWRRWVAGEGGDIYLGRDAAGTQSGSGSRSGSGSGSQQLGWRSGRSGRRKQALIR